MIDTAIILIGAHLLFYTYFMVGSYIIKIARSRNLPPSMTILRLMGEYKTNVRMFNYNGQPYGFAWFNTIWLNTNLETLRKNGKSDRDWMLKWAFHHEYYHVRHHHKFWIIFTRVLFSFVPILLVIDWMLFTSVYVSAAYIMYRMNEAFEKKANDYAAKKMNHNG